MRTLWLGLVLGGCSLDIDRLYGDVDAATVDAGPVDTGLTDGGTSSDGGVDAAKDAELLDAELVDAPRPDAPDATVPFDAGPDGGAVSLLAVTAVFETTLSDARSLSVAPTSGGVRVAATSSTAL